MGERFRFPYSPGASISPVILLEGEARYDMDADELIVGDGVTRGGKGALAWADGSNLNADWLVRPVYAPSFGVSVSNTAAANATALAAAFAYARTLGGCAVYLPAAGVAYPMAPVSMSNGDRLIGDWSHYFNGVASSEADWTARGTWIKPSSTSTACFTLTGHGAGIHGLHFIYDQPTPNGGAYTPTAYAHAIKITTSLFDLEKILVLNGTHGVSIDYGNSGGGSYSTLRDLYLSCFNEGLYTSQVNDVLRIFNLCVRRLWYTGDTGVNDYVFANLCGWNCGYTDNPMVFGYECLQGAKAFHFFDETIGSDTHSLYNAQIFGLQANLTKQLLTVAANTTHVKARFIAPLLQQGPGFGSTVTDIVYIPADSDNVDLDFSAASVRDVGSELMTLGGGAGGKATFDGVIDSYASASAGKVCFNAAAGAKLAVSPATRLTRVAGNGAVFTGAGSYARRLLSWSPFATFGQATGTCNGSAQGVTVDHSTAPDDVGAVEARISGEINITGGTGVGNVVALRLSNFATITVTGIDAQSTGFKVFDSGWIKLPTIGLTTEIGRVQIIGTTSVTWSNGSLTIELR